MKFLGKLTIAIFFIVPVVGRAQDCDCKKNLDSLISVVELNYVGFSAKVNKTTADKYKKLVDSLYRECTAPAGYDCYLLLKRYVLFFRDPHLTLNITEERGASSEILKSIFSNFPRREGDEKKLKAYYDSLKTDPLEGIWKCNLVKYNVAIIKDSSGKNDYLGIVTDGDSLFWFPGQTKLEINRDGLKYRVTYNRYDHYPDIRTMRVDDGRMLISGYGTWEKIYPIPKVPYPNKNFISFEKLPNNITLLTLGSFSLRSKVLIDSLIQENYQAITQSKCFIIDLRNNSGGVSMAYDLLTPLLYTEPIVQDGFIVRSSPANIAVYKSMAADPAYSKTIRDAFQEIVAKMERHPNSLVTIHETDTVVYDSLPSGPSKVAIIVNDGVISAGEMFLLQARQSKKVTIFGTRTRGALDYTEFSDINLPCNYLALTCPMGMKAHKVDPYIDNIGIKPDIIIPETSKDWVDYVVKYYTSSHK